MLSIHSLVSRALAAVLLMLAFYLLAIAAACGLVWLLFLLPSLHLGTFCLVGAAMILWSIVPRPDRFEPPGPRIDLEREPRLKGVLATLASATGQPMPQDVYVMYDANAFVSRRGGMMGFFSRPVMGLGLALMSSLSESEMRAVIAHEFGHFHGGDTHVGPWIQKTRSAIGRTVENLAQSRASILRWPFHWYAMLFLRITQAISRQQELSADALAARTVSAGALARGLLKIESAAACFDGYFGEFRMALQGGLRLPFVNGFEHMMSASESAPRIAKLVEDSIAHRKPDPFDSHPPTRERIAALAQSKAKPASDSERRSICWFMNLDEIERALLVHATRRRDVEKLREIRWDQTAELMWIPIWESRCRKSAKLLRGRTVSEMPQLVVDAEKIGIKMLGVDNYDEYVAAGLSLLGAAFGLALHRRGWISTTEPGSAMSFSRGKATLRPMEMVSELAQDPEAVAAWGEFVSLYELGSELLELPETRPAVAAG